MYIDDNLLIDYESLSDLELGVKIREILNNIHNERKIKDEKIREIEYKQSNCKHLHGSRYVVTEWFHGKPDRSDEYCEDCGKLLSS